MQVRVTDISVRTQFGKHVPRILRRQLILQLMHQYLNAEAKEEDVQSSKVEVTLNECKPSIQRFHGALLFVDISGFTVLSQQLTVDDLKFHINEYFTKMLDIVDKHGGDVIKFAGDALFIVWETTQMMKVTEDSDLETTIDFAAACKMAVTTAVECGLEINLNCSNHKVPLVDRSAETHKASASTPSSGILPSLAGLFHGRGSIAMPTPEEPPAAFLNVHAGVSMGLMAGIDIGYNDRWEYFLMGEPLSKVAMAEAQAMTGEIVICPEAHAVLHPVIRPKLERALTKLKICKSIVSKTGSADDSGSTSVSISHGELQEIKKAKEHFSDQAINLTCGCAKGINGYCKVKQLISTPTSYSKRSKLRTKLDEVFVFEETNNEIESVFDSFVGNKLAELQSVEDIQHEFFRDLSNSVALNTHIHDHMGGIARAVTNVKTIGDRVKLEFVKWAHSCLIDDVARHVHDVVRSDYNFEDTSRIDVCRREITKQLTTLNASQSVLKAKEKFHAAMMRSRLKTLEKSASILEGTGQMLKRSSSHRRMSLAGAKRKGSSSNLNLLKDDNAGAGFSAELRSVTVMFVKIDIPHLDLLVEKDTYADFVGQFGFLTKTVNESLADVLLLHRLQSCFEALTESFCNHGGQLRQFIVDDKGTVCIGTFGLRGAVTDDNAAAAIETAQMIVEKLQGLGLNCSIGVTMGKAFCGLVGSSNRHEYAVMGPSTNLSARLMCKAPPGGVICDMEIRSHDRTHKFVALGDIVAKGYAKPVSTFKPQDKENDTFNRTKLMTMLSYQRSQSIKLGDDIRSLKVALHTDQMVRQDTMNFVRQETMNLKGSFSSFCEEDEDQSVTYIITKMCKGPFYGTPSEQVSPAGETRNEMIGRDEEVRSILVFLFNKLIDDEGESSKFKLDQPSRFAGVMGAQGLGKSSVMAAVVHQVTGIAVTNRSLRVHIFKSRVSGFQAAVPFNAWKDVFKEILLRMYTIARMRGKKRPNQGSMHNRTAGTNEIKNGVEYVISQLPERLQRFGPLLGYLTIVPEVPGELAALGMSNQEMNLAAMDLLFEIIQVYVSTAKTLVFLMIEDVHAFDLASQLLLRHIWTSGRGVVVLFSAEHKVVRAPKIVTRSSMVMTPDASAFPTTPLSTFSPYRDAAPLQMQPPTSEIAQDDLLNIATDFAATLHDGERYLHTELQMFSEEQTAVVVKAAMSSCGVVGTDAAILNKIYRESGGNPMYAYELAKSVAQRHSQLIDPSMISVRPRNCHRLEEIICHRFDQLNTSAQTLLKIAAAICCYGSNFTCKMVTFIMSDSDGVGFFAEQKAIIEDLLDIVNSESFLVARHIQDETHDSWLQERDIDGADVAKDLYTFEFGISLEKTTIYELLLSDQKQSIHERIAEYYQVTRQQNPNCIAHFYEESLHWQRASNWSYAMACSYHASLVESDWRKANDHIFTAYRMYRSMREQKGQMFVLPGSPQNHVDLSAPSLEVWSARHMRGLYEQAMANADDLTNSEHSALTLEQTSRLFNCDSELLKISMNVEVLMARKCLSKPDRAKECQLNLEEAFQMLLLTKNPYLLSNARVTQLMHFLHHMPKEKSSSVSSASGDPAVEVNLDNYFCMGTEFDTVLLKLLSVYVESYLRMVNEPDLTDMLDKVTFALELFQEKAAALGEFHEVQSLCLDVQFECKCGNLKQAAALAGELTEFYQRDKHPQDLIDFYGRDMVPASLAMIAQYLFLSSEWRTPQRLNSFAKHCVEKMTHVDSIAAAIFYLVNTLVFQKHIDEALHLFMHYLECLGAANAERAITDGIYVEWLRRLVKYELFVKTGHRHLFDNDSTLIDTMIEDCTLALNMENTTGEPMQFDTFAVQGCGIDAVLAEICALKIIVLWNEPNKAPELRNFCRSLGVYVRSTLTTSSGRSHELMFSKTNTVLTVIYLLQSLDTVAPLQMKHGLTVRDDFVDLERPHLKEELRDVVTTQLLDFMWLDCHPQYSCFPLLAMSVLRKLRISLGSEDEPADDIIVPPSEGIKSHFSADFDDNASDRPPQESEDLSVSFEAPPTTTDVSVVSVESPNRKAGPETAKFAAAFWNSEVKRSTQQFLMNGNTAVKVKVMEQSKISKLIPTM